MKYYFPVHLNGGNRGCEGIAKGTAMILGEEKDSCIGLCTDPQLDHLLGVDEYVHLLPSRRPSFLDRVMFHVYPHIWSNEKLKRFYEKYRYDGFLKRITDKDIMLSTGGDMLCYENNFINYTNNIAHKKGVKTVLWGCSMGPENLTPEKEETLHNFSLVYARDSMTAAFFHELGLKNVFCYPDPAFVLAPEETILPSIYQKGDVIGINVSNYVLGGFTLETPFGQQVKHLIDYILSETQLNVLLIPHVTWREQDDRIVAKMIKEVYAKEERITILDITNINYCQIRYVISKCKFFIGARTHAVISAYSTSVPTLALGYSIKSRGIAKDLGIPEQLVVNSKKAKSENELMDSFEFLCKMGDDVRHSLQSIMPDYCKRPYTMRDIVKELIEK